MGEPKFARPKFDTPSHPWKAERIEEEHADSEESRPQEHARDLEGQVPAPPTPTSSHALDRNGRRRHLAAPVAREDDDLTRSLHGKGLIASDASLDDILSLGTEDILNRRLQAQVYYKGLAATMKQARQLVTHGHICVGDQKGHHPIVPCEPG